ncbi:metal-dependent transcriptional regulator [Clostridium sp. P21]|uniref:Metal-dependent transcriptional regulator n=1 Tax=Clostridium muellerianum TaxID=2716538 RepID=A0A7Y0EEF0_9CLOT|nr:metal-dependent transcriptional regulator [Clostridium muellerianum]NMM61873.1 metal-dependent transcriptional regulator [Clostridium muellerianum]
MKIQESAENYLETILILQKTLNAVRSIDIVNELNYTKASVSIAMKKLRENGYIEMDKDGYISLTKAGLAIAEKMYERHETLSSFLMFLGVNKKTSLEDACRIEHVISDESFDKIKKYIMTLPKH